ncbi:MAG: hypothetical protein MJH09_04920 [Cetobacterium sp.]|nr:hypothetical protein [Cetobacterium sp.]
MKKLLLVGTLILSVGAFAMKYDDTINNRNYHHNPYSNCSMMGGENHHKGHKKYSYLTDSQRDEIAKIKITISEKKLALKKLMLERNINWSQVEKLNEEIGDMSAKLKTDIMKYRYENSQNYSNNNEDLGINNN